MKGFFLALLALAIASVIVCGIAACIVALLQTQSFAMVPLLMIFLLALFVAIDSI